MNLSIFKPVKRGQKVLPVFSKVELRSILCHSDTYTDIGKRDYAFFLPAATTGMRGSDIQGRYEKASYHIRKILSRIHLNLTIWYGVVEKNPFPTKS